MNAEIICDCQRGEICSMNKLHVEGKPWIVAINDGYSEDGFRCNVCGVDLHNGAELAHVGCHLNLDGSGHIGEYSRYCPRCNTWLDDRLSTPSSFQPDHLTCPNSKCQTEITYIYKRVCIQTSFSQRLNL